MFLQVLLMGLLSVTSSLEYNAKDSGSCVNKDLHRLSERQFFLDACGWCYEYIPPQLFHQGMKLTYKQVVILLATTFNSSYAHFSASSNDTLADATFASSKGAALWRRCCRAAVRCCQVMMADEPNISPTSSYCGRQWDGWQCIRDTPTDSTAQVACPSYIYFFSQPPNDYCPSYATKQCYADGSWENKTNYNSCGQASSFKRRVYVHIAASAVSILALIPAVLIFSLYKSAFRNKISIPKSMLL